MIFSETGFRPLYHQFCAFPVNDGTRKVLTGFPGAENATYMLTYGYITEKDGLMLEVIAAGEEKEGRRGEFGFADTSHSIDAKLPIAALKNYEYLYFGESRDGMAVKYAAKISSIREDAVSPDVEKSRQFNFIDSLRDETHPDVVRVTLVKDGSEPEEVKARIDSLDQPYLIGVLEDEPKQNPGYHRGEKIAFRTYKTKENEYFLEANLNPAVHITREDLKDGQMVRHAVEQFDKEADSDNLFMVLTLLRDSMVFVPCIPLDGDVDQGDVKMAGEHRNASDSVSGTETESADTARLVPDILKNENGAIYFPAFTTKDELKKNLPDDSLMEIPMTEAVNLAEKTTGKIIGIVLDPYSQPFILDSQFMKLLKQMKSNLE